MTVFITGDTHGHVSIGKLSRNKGFDPDGLTREDCVIVLGDFGLVWHDPPTSQERYWLDWLESKPWTTLFIDGNHEKHALLGSLPEKGWHGGRVHVVRDHVLHLMRGHVFEIGGSTFFAMGGARSSDMEWRKPYKSWWPEEVPSADERARAADAIAEAGEVDYVLTHCPPAKELVAVSRKVGFTPELDAYSNWLQTEVADRLVFRRWFYGHLHLDMPDRRPFTPLFNEILALKEGGC